MPVIIGSGQSHKKEEAKKKQLYTWVGCGLVVVLSLFAVIPSLGSTTNRQPAYEQYSRRAQDLAELPFATDAATAEFLQNNPSYGQVANTDLVEGLFSKEERATRQEEDKVQGIPSAPDKEYKEIAVAKEKAKEAQGIRASRIARATVQPARTSSGSLSSSRGQTDVKGSSNVTGSIWRSDDKNKTSSSANYSATGKTVTVTDVANAKKYGRNTGFFDATLQSGQAANAADAETAASGAVDAFQNAAKDDDFLNKDKEELGLENLPAGIGAELSEANKRDLAEDLNDKIANEQEKKEKEENDNSLDENCMTKYGELSTKCLLAKFAIGVGEGLIQAGTTALTSRSKWTAQDKMLYQANKKWFKDPNNTDPNKSPVMQVLLNGGTNK